MPFNLEHVLADNAHEWSPQKDGRREDVLHASERFFAQQPHEITQVFQARLKKAV